MNNELETIIKAADSKRAANIQVLDIRELSIISDYFIIMSGETQRQVQAIANEILDKAKENNFPISRVEGLSEANWVVLDLGDYIVHVFDEDSYEFYELYRLWNTAKPVDVSEYIVED
ncbi:MAG: ribosome silencing factor [Lactobacillaceae bacterium]|jgi:ribosome-associated protein|nr:ribosome silencing factor [Lactobacillaceae bacterium]